MISKKTFLRLMACVVVAVAAPQMAQADEALIGSWKMTTSVQGGKEQTAGVGIEVSFGKDRVHFHHEAAKKGFSYEVNEKTSPKQFDIILPVSGGPRLQGIYRIEGDKLTMCIPLMPKLDGKGTRPTEFRSTAANGLQMQTFTRMPE